MVLKDIADRFPTIKKQSSPVAKGSGTIFVCRFCVLVFEDAQKLSHHVQAQHPAELAAAAAQAETLVSGGGGVVVPAKLPVVAPAAAPAAAVSASAPAAAKEGHAASRPGPACSKSPKKRTTPSKLPESVSSAGHAEIFKCPKCQQVR